jgi:hypothetical protein
MAVILGYLEKLSEMTANCWRVIAKREEGGSYLESPGALTDRFAYEVSYGFCCGCRGVGRNLDGPGKSVSCRFHVPQNAKRGFGGLCAGRPNRDS